MDSPRSFIVVGSARALVVQVLLAARTFANARCIAVCARNTRFLRYSNLHSAYLEIDFRGADDERFVEAVNRFSHRYPGLILVAADCDGTRITNRVRDRLKAQILPIPDTPTLEGFDNKWLFHQFCTAHGLKVPASRLAKSKSDIDFQAAASELGLPFIIKPLDQQGSKGVQVIRDEKAFRRLVLENAAYRYAPLMVQRYVRGTDVGVNLLAIDGEVKALAVQRRDAPQDEGAPIEFLAHASLESSARRLAKESAYTGVMNIDARIEDGSGEVLLFEANPRFWRSLSASVWCGLNFVAEMVEPRYPLECMPVLQSGRADTFYHPLFRPRLCIHALAGRGRRGRLARLLLFEVCTLGSSVMALWRRAGRNDDSVP